MTIIRNQRGIALVLVMILALIGLAIVSALIYMGTMSTRLSGAEKVYRNSDEAAFGGARVAADMVIDNIGQSALTTPSAVGALGGTVATAFGTATAQTCLLQKLNNPPGTAFANWSSCNANERNLDPKDNWDMTFPLPGVPHNYVIYAKVVDTIQGNTAGTVIPGGGSLTTGGVGGGGASIVTPPRHSWMYRIEVQSEDSINPKERARYALLYAH